MAKFKVSVPHHMQRDAAIEKLVGFSEQIRTEMPVELTEIEESWDEQGNLDFSFKAMGMVIEGKMVTCEANITVNGKMPFAALPFRGTIESTVAEKIRSAMSS